MDTSSKARINSDTMALNDTLDQKDLIEPFTPKKQNMNYFQMHVEHFQRQITW